MKNFIKLILLLLVVGYLCHFVLERRAVQVIQNPNSESKDFFNAFNHIGMHTKPPSFWLGIASDKSYSADKRRRCVKYFFDNYVCPVMRLVDLVDAIKTQNTWISYDYIYHNSRDIAGTVQPVITLGQCCFTAPVLLEREGDYHLVIFIALNDYLKRDEFISVLKGNLKTGTMSNTVIVGCQTWTDADELAWTDTGELAATQRSASFRWPWLKELDTNDHLWIDIRRAH